jgi:transcriptional regulator with PAS, ATPase and Fis domain
MLEKKEVRSMSNERWVREFPAAITVCDTKGILLAMNDKAVSTFEADGGEALIGTNLLDCHPEPSRTQVVEMLKSGSPNVYTIQKGGIRKLIYQSPWFLDGKYAGFVELSLPIPEDMPHFNRDAPPAS